MKSDHASPLASFARFFRRLVSSETSRKPPSPSPSPQGGSGKCVSLDNDIHRVFEYFDENGDGKISASELQSRLRKVGGDERSQLSDEEAEMVVRTSDADGDGELGLDDFAKMMEGGGEEQEGELREAFGMYSAGAEGSVVITPKSLRRMLSRLGQSSSVEECKAMIGKFDANGDGVLDFSEFRTMMR